MLHCMDDHSAVADASIGPWRRSGHPGKGNVRNFVRAILTIGAGVRLEKEFRDILVDLVLNRACYACLLLVTP